MKLQSTVILFLLFVCVFSFCPYAWSQGAHSVTPQAENPFVQMVGKAYKDYHDSYAALTDSLYGGQEADREKLIRMLDQAAEVDPSSEWKLNARIEAANIRYYKSRKGGFIESGDYAAEDFISDLQKIAVDADKQNFPHIKLKAWASIAAIYRIFVQNYEEAFVWYLKVTGQLDAVSTKDYPPRPYIYNEIASFYYSFRDYPNAIAFYSKVTRDKDAPDNYFFPVWPAYNGLGLCYRNSGEWQKSDSCFRFLLKIPEKHLWVWKGIANGNLGYNRYMQGDYDGALPLLQSSITDITRPNDFEFISSRAVNIADIYLKKGNTRSAKKYIDTALEYLQKSGMADKSSELYTAMSKYYGATGNPRLASAYFDSALLATNNNNEAFSGLVLRRVEQKLNATERDLQQRKFNEERVRRQTYQWIAFSVFIALTIVVFFLLIYCRLYRKKRDAYKELAAKAEQWAASDSLEVVETSSVPDNGNGTPNGNQANGNDKKIMTQIHTLMKDEKVFKESKLTLDSLAEQIGVNRSVLSKAINSTTGKNFNQFVNDYRIREAIRIISCCPSHSKVYIDELYDQVGFSSRSPFYLAFKKSTGLSPSEYIAAKEKT